jgi:integrase
MKLTKTIVEGAAPRAQRYRLNDSLIPGLCLLVLPSGARTYYLRFRQLDGRQLEMKLGTPVELTPDDARRLAREALSQVREGRRPTEERRAMRQASTLADLAREHLERHAAKKRSGACDEANWRVHLLPALGAATKVAAVNHEDVARWHAGHRQLITANRALRTLSVAMRLAEQWGWRPHNSNPCKGVKPHRESARRRYLSQDELTRLRAALAQWEEAGPLAVRWRFAKLVRLLLLTGARLREVMCAEWRLVDWDRRVLLVPAKRGKTGAAEVHLSDRAIEVLRELLGAHAALGEPSPWIIPGADRKKALVGYRKLWLALLQEAGVDDLRVHDLRHSFASYALSGGQTLGVVGQLLGHRSTQTTSRYAHLITETAQAAVARVSDDLGV